MPDRAHRVTSVLLTASAVVFAVIAVRREFFLGQTTVAPSESRVATLQFDPEWKELLKSGVSVGVLTAPIQIIEFFDLECPACRAFHRGALQEIKQRFGDSVRVTFVHYPLTNHRFARIAAQAAECADEQGRFGTLIDAMYHNQDSLGVKSWGSFARDAGVKDTISFNQCVLGPLRFARVDSGIALAERKEITAIPALFVNGWRFSRPPLSGQLSQVTDDLLSGQSPAR